MLAHGNLVGYTRNHLFLQDPSACINPAGGYKRNKMALRRQDASDDELHQSDDDDVFSESDVSEDVHAGM